MKRNYLLFLLLMLSIRISAQCSPLLTDRNGTSGTVTLSCASLSSTGGYDLRSSGFPVAPKSSAGYAVQSVPYAPQPFSGAGSREIDVFPDPYAGVRDEDYVAKVDLATDPLLGGSPFIFNMYGQAYPSFLISSNGFITFDQDIFYDQGETWSTSFFANQPIPSASLPRLAVLGVFQDSEFVEGTSRLFISVTGTSPCRTIVIHFENLRIKGTAELVTSLIVLHELTSEVEVFVGPRANTSNVPGIVGITNYEGDKGTPAPERNGGNWSATAGEGWKFSPSGTPVRRDILWYKDNGVTKTRLNTSAYNNRTDVTVYPEEIPQQKFIVEYVYYLPGGNYVITREINIRFDADYPLVKNATVAVCGSTENISAALNQNVSVNPAGNFNFYYYKETDFAVAQSGEPSLPGPLDTNKIYYVRVESKTDPNCFNIATIKLASTPVLLTSPPVVEICQLRATNFTFAQLECQLLEAGFYRNARFKINDPDLSGSGLYRSGSVVPATLANGDQLYMWVDTDCGNDIQLGPITVQVNSGPNITGIFPSLLNVELCQVEPLNITRRTFRLDWTDYFIKNGYLTQDPVNQTLMLGSQTVKVSVHLSQTDARNGSGAINYVSDQAFNKVWIRVEEISTDPCIKGCFSITPVDVTVSFPIILNVKDDDVDAVPDSPTIFDLETADVYICRSSATRTVDFNADSDRIITTNGVSHVKTYHTSLADANNLASTGIASTFSLAANVAPPTRYIRYRILDAGGNKTDCYTVKQLNYHVQTIPVAANQIFNVCYSDLPKTVIISGYQPEMLRRMFPRSVPDYTLRFFDSQTGGSPVSEFDLSAALLTKAVFVEVPTDPNYGSCAVPRVEFVFKAIANPILDVASEININVSCRNVNADTGAVINTYDLTSLIPRFTTGNYTVNYYRNYNAATGAFGGFISAAQAKTFPLNATGTQTVYYHFKTTGSECFTVGKVNFIINTSTTPAVRLNTGIIVLKCSGPPAAFFNLYDAIPQLYDGLGNPDFDTYIGRSGVTFYEYKSDTDVLNATNLIADPTSYSVLYGDNKYVWARFETGGGCFSQVKFRLRQVDSRDFKFQATPFIISVCDNNLDGKETVNLLEWLNQNKLTHPGFFYDTMISAGANYSFFNADMTPITAPETFSITGNTEIYINASANGCTSDSKKISLSITNPGVLTFTHQAVCIETPYNLQFIATDPAVTGATSFEFYRNESDLISGNNRIQNPSSYLYEQGINTVYVKITGPGTCPRKGIINLSLLPSPTFSFANSGVYYFCKNGGEVDITISTAGNPVRIREYIIKKPDGTTVTVPNTQFYTANMPGNYELTVVGENGCRTTKPFEVKTYETPEIYKIVVDGNRVTVLATAPNASRTIQYSYLDPATGVMVPWQTNYIFNNVPAGVKEFLVRYADSDIYEGGCLGMPMKTLILSGNNVITPNGDGYNDTWKISDLDIFDGQVSSLKIFDRYNKIVFEQTSASEIEWNGFYAGRVLPTSTYWYVLTVADGRQVTGWILLKNRD